MKNKLHRVALLVLDSPKKKPKFELKPCGCNANDNHPEPYEDYVKRARAAGAKWEA